MRRYAVLLAAAALAACSGSPSATPTSPTGTSPAVASTPPSPPVASDAGDPTAVARIGGPGILLDTGLRVSVPGGATHALGRTDIVDGHQGDTVAIVTVVIENTTKAPVDVSLAAVRMTAGGQEAPAYVDARWGSDDHFAGSVPPRRVLSARFGYLVPASALHDLTVEVWPTQTQQTAIFTNAAS